MKPGLPHPLLTSEAWEVASLRSLNLSSKPHSNLAQLVQAYTKISDFHSISPHQPTGRTEPKQSESEASLVVRMLIFARRTFLITHALSSLLPKSPAWICEHGAGFAPALLALPNFGPQFFTELFSEYDLARSRMFSEMGLPSPKPLNSARSLQSGGLNIYPFSLFEFSRGSHEAAADILEDKHQNDYVLILEPGDQQHAAFIQGLRDTVLSRNCFRVAAPCFLKAPCPMTGTKDWCHFRLSHRPTPLEERILSSANRTVSRLVYSYLLLQPSREDLRQLSTDSYSHKEPGLVQTRLLSVRPEGKSKVKLLTCGTNGLASYDVLKRHRGLYHQASSLVPGSEVLVPNHRLQKKSLRIAESDKLSVSWTVSSQKSQK